MERHFNNLDLYRILFRIVRGWPPVSVGGVEAPCRRLNTFAVIHRNSDLNSDTLGKTPEYVDRKLFFSRIWEESGYNPSAFAFALPGLFIWQNTVEDARIDDATYTVGYTLGIAMDRPDPSTQIDGPCGKITLEEAEFYLGEFYTQVAQELTDMVKANFVVTGSEGPGFSTGFSLGFDSGAAGTANTDNVGYSDQWVSYRWLRDMATNGLIEPDYETLDEIGNYVTASQPSSGILVKDAYTRAPLLMLMDLSVQYPVCSPVPAIDYLDENDLQKKTDQGLVTVSDMPTE